MLRGVVRLGEEALCCPELAPYQLSAHPLVKRDRPEATVRLHPPRRLGRNVVQLFGRNQGASDVPLDLLAIRLIPQRLLLGPITTLLVSMRVPVPALFAVRPRLLLAGILPALHLR